MVVEIALPNEEIEYIEVDGIVIVNTRYKKKAA